MKLVIFLFLFLFLIMIINFYIVKEHYTFKKENKKYDVNKPLPISLRRYPEIYNNNYNSKYLPEIKEFNNDNVNDLAYNTNKIVPQILNNSLTSEFIKNIIFEYNNTDYIISDDKFNKLLNNFEFLKKIDDEIIDTLNKKTYVNNINFNPNKDINFIYIKSDINEINIINKYFINSFNKIFNIYYKKIYKKYEFVKNKFLIYKYKIVNMYKSNNIYFFELILELIKINGFMITQLFITSYIYNGKIFLKPIVLIGFKTLDDILLNNNYNNNYYYNIISSHNNDGIINKDEIKHILNKRQFEINKNIDIKTHYNCFNNNLNDKNILNSNNKQICESNYDPYGREKQYGIWDRPCSSDKECVYYKLNKNYPNTFGKCLNNGNCENPINVKNISYHIFDNKNKPLCYNCNTTSWKAITNLNDCCDDQKDRKKYPFLKGPDYAFKNDFEKRFNYNIYNKSYIKYNNIFNDKKFNIYKFD